MKISDFKFAEHFVRVTLKHFGAPLVDVEIEFSNSDDKSQMLVVDGKIIVNNSKSLSETLGTIISVYLMNTGIFTKQCDISPEDLTSIVNSSVAQIRAIVHSEQSLPEPDTSKPIVSKLSQYPFVWIMLRDIVCPTYECPLKNYEVLRARSPKIDVAYFVDKDDVKAVGVTVPFIFLNSEVESNVFKSAFLLRAAIKSHCSEYGICPDFVIQQLLTSDEIKDVVSKYIKMAFVIDSDINDFLFALCAISNMPDTSKVMPASDGTSKGSSLFREANKSDSPLIEGNWWMMGLYEGMLESTHGRRTDEVSQSLAPFIKDLWERVAAEKKLQGKEDMSLENILRVQSQEFRAKKGVTLQGLLSDQRIW